MQQQVETPFDGNSTCYDVINGVDLTGKLAVITGGSAGLGKATARALGQAGADLFLGARSLDILEAVEKELASEVRGQIYTCKLDLSVVSSADSFADAVLELNRPVDLLVNNAGIMACPQACDERGNELQFSTNFLGHAVLTSRLAPALAAADAARLISLSSTAHHYSPVDFDDPNFGQRPYERWSAYGQSKTANALLARKVANELGVNGVRAFAVHPGMIHTDLSKYLTPEIMQENMQKLEGFLHNMRPMKTVEGGAATSVWAATSSLLNDRHFAYLEDCSVAEVVEEPNYGFGVLGYAIDNDNADQLWALGERMLNRPLPLTA